MNPTIGLQGRLPLALVHNYYARQAGGGIDAVFAGERYQRGHGLGSFFAGLFRSAMPLITSGLKALGRQALSSGGDVLSDVMQGVPLKASFASRTRDGAQALGGKLKRKLDEFQSGSGAKRQKLDGNSLYMGVGTRKHPQFFVGIARGRESKTRGNRSHKPRKKGEQKKKTAKKKAKKATKKKAKKATKAKKPSRKLTTDIFN